MKTQDEHIHSGEQYPLEIKDTMDSAEERMARKVFSTFSKWNAPIYKWAVGIIQDFANQNIEIKKADEKPIVPTEEELAREIESAISVDDFNIDNSVLAIPMQKAVGYSFDMLATEVGSKSMASSVLAAMHLSFDIQYDMALYNRILADRKEWLAGELYDTTVARIPEIISKGIEKGATIDEMTKSIQDVLGMDKDRAAKIARTETNYAANEAIRQQTHTLGIMKYRISTAVDSCTLCQQASAKEYSFNEANDLLPYHPNCRCVLQSIIPKSWLGIQKSIKERGIQKTLEKGYIPIKGMDYYTDDEIEEVKKAVTPVRGKDYLTKEELKKVKEEIAPKKGVDYLVKKEVEQIRKEMTPVKGKDYVDGYTPVKGVDYFDGERGKRGFKGKDGSPDKPEEIVEKLESIQEENNKLSTNAIKNFDKEVRKRIPKVEIKGGGGSGKDWKVKVDGTDTENFLENKVEAGSNVTITKVDGKLKIAALGDGWTTDHADLDNLDYASSGHTGFQPAGSYLTSETDPIYSASEAANFEAGDKDKLDGIEAGAEVNAIESLVAGNDIDIDVTDSENPVISLEDDIDVDTVQFNTTFSDGCAEGRLQWNSEDGTLEVGMPGGNVNLQIGQETLVRVKSGEAGTIPNGSVVYVSGASGSRPLAKLATADNNFIANSVIGVATEDVTTSTGGYVTMRGLVRGLDTSDYSEGDILYLSSTEAGKFQTTAPDSPNSVVAVGICLFSNNESGIIAVDPRGLSTLATRTILTDSGDYYTSSNVEGALQEIGEKFEDMFEPTGFVNRTSSTITFSDSTPDRTLTITPSTSFDIYEKGIKYTKTEAESIQISDVTGIHVVYYDGGVLSEIVNPTDAQNSLIIRTKPIVSYLYWNATSGSSVYVGEERHGIQMDGNTHAYLHFTEGLRYISGLGLNSIVLGDGSLDTHAQFGVDTGDVSDEDIYDLIQPVLSTTGLPILYMLGDEEWYKATNAGYSVLKTGIAGEDRLAYNELDGSNWKLTEVTDGDYVLCHVFATTEKDTPMIAIVGQNEYNNVVSARTGADVEIKNLILNELPLPEIRPIATLILQTNDGYANAMKARVVATADGNSYVDWRDDSISRVEISTTDHNSLTGKQGGTLGEYYHVTAAEKTVIENTSGTNTGDQDISGIGNALKIQGFDVTETDPTDGKILVYRTATSEYVLEDKPESGDNPAASDVSFVPAGDISATDVQNAIQELDNEKVSKSFAIAMSVAL